MYFFKNKYINKVLGKYYKTFSVTKDTYNYVPQKYNDKVLNYIFKDLTKKFKEIEVYTLLDLESKGLKLGWLQRLKIYFSGLREIYKFEQLESLAKKKGLCPDRQGLLALQLNFSMRLSKPVLARLLRLYGGLCILKNAQRETKYKRATKTELKNSELRKTKIFALGCPANFSSQN